MKKQIHEIVSSLKQVAAELKVHPSRVTINQFLEKTSFTEWDIRKHGGLSSIAKSHFPQSEKELGVIVRNKEVTKYINKLEKSLGEKENFERELKAEIVKSIKNLKIQHVKIAKPHYQKGFKNMTMELMLSDIHYGLLSDTFNLKICRERMRHLVSVFLREIEGQRKLFNVERVIIALIGDIIQSFTMHGLESAIGCEFGNAKQVEAAIRSLFEDVLLPIAKTGIKIDVPAVTGNHDRTEQKRTFHNPGENNLTWIVYNSLEMLCQQAKLTNVKFHIPKESHVVLNIYGSNICFEHGDNSGGSDQKAMENLLKKRERQSNLIIHFFRSGHWHSYFCYDFGKFVGNLSVCGEESFGQILGFVSTAGQVINYYIETKTRPSPFYKSFPVYLGHINRGK